MKKNYILGVFAVASLLFTACSQDEIVNEVVNPNGEEQPLDGALKPLGSFQIDSKLGGIYGSTAQTRTLGDVDDKFRPSGNYHLNYIYMLSLNPSEQPLEGSHDYEPSYDKHSSTMHRHALNNGSYNLYYGLGEDVVDNSPKNASNSGTVYLSPTKNPSDIVPFKLSVFDLGDLHNTENGVKRIPLNHFAFNHNVDGNLRGTTLRYTSYNPTEVGTKDETTYGPHEDLKGRYVPLPELTDEKYNFLKGGEFDKLYTECRDEFFSGSEFLLAADKDSIYLLQVVPVKGDNGGYFEVRSYPTPKGDANPQMLALNRLTSVVNANFILVDEKPGKSEYFVEGDEAKTLKNFKNKYGVDLSKMECPYATMDGINTRFYINEFVSPDKCTDTGRLVLWAKDNRIKCVDGEYYDYLPERSMNVGYNFGSGDVKRQGYGMKGQSYNVVFQGLQGDNASQNIIFYVTVEGVNIKMIAPITPDGVTLNKNVSHNFVVFAPADRFAQAVKDAHAGQLKNTRSGADEFVELNLSSDCVEVY